MSLRITLAALSLVTVTSSALAADINYGPTTVNLRTSAVKPPSKRKEYQKPKSSKEYNSRVNELDLEEKKLRKQLETDAENARNYSKSFVTQLREADEKIKGMETQLKEDKKYHSPTKVEIEAMEKAIRSAKNERKNLVANRENIEKNREIAKEKADQLEDINEEGIRLKADFYDIQKGLHTQLKFQGITMEYDKLDKFYDNNDNRLEAIANYYDKTVLGAYVQDKITQLARSEVMCEAALNCMTENNKKVSAIDIQNELFHNSNSARSHNQPTLESTKIKGGGISGMPTQETK